MSRIAVAAQKGAPGWAATTPLAARQVLNDSEILEERIDELADCHRRRARKGPLGRRRLKFSAAWKSWNFATAAPQLLKGELTEKTSERASIAIHASASRRVAGITPFNFPRDGADVDVSCRACLRKRLHLEAVRRIHRPSVIVAEWLKEAGLPDGVFGVVHGDKETVDGGCCIIPTFRDQFRGIHTDRHGTSTKRLRRREALPGVRCQEPHDHHADATWTRHRPSNGRPLGSAGERCMAISVAVPGGRNDRNRLISALARRFAASKSDLHGPEAEWARRHQAAFDKVRGYIDAGVAEGAKLLVDGRDFKMQVTNTVTSSAAHCLITSLRT